MAGQLEGLRILILEDEYLIAMDVEQLCRDHGASEVSIQGSLDGLDLDHVSGYDAAIIDVMLQGRSTLELARAMQLRGLPFIFASGYTSFDEVFTNFPGVAVLGKPYAGSELVDALALALDRSRPAEGPG